MAHYKLILKSSTGNVNNGFVGHIEDGGWANGIITDAEGNELGRHCSSTLSLLRHVPFNKETDTYEKNW